MTGFPAAAPVGGSYPIDPRNPDTSYNAGLAALKAGREAEALPILEAAQKAYPRDPRLWQVAGLLHRSLDDLAPAVAAFAQAARLAPNDPLIAHGHARAALEAGLPAVELFERAHRLAPLDGPLLLGLAAARSAELGIAAAMSGIEEQLNIHPGWMPGHALMARLKTMSGAGEEATASIERAIAIAPRDIALWRELIWTLVQAERFDEALAAVARARSVAGEHIAFAVHHAVCLAELGETEAADRHFAALGQVDDVTVAVRRIRHLLRSGRPEEAAAIAEPISVTADGNLVWPYLSIAWRLLGDSRWEWLEGDERFVGVYDLAEDLPSLDALGDRLRALHIATAQPFDQSVRGGTQTDGPLFSRIEPEIRALRAAVVRAVERHIAQLPPPLPGHPTLIGKRAPVRFSGSWSVRLTAAGFHANHIHPAGWISSAFYVSLPPKGPGREGWLTLGSPQAQLAIDLPPTRLIEPKPGRLILFPSTMWHGTIPFSAGERLTAAFDVAPPA